MGLSKGHILLGLLHGFPEAVDHPSGLQKLPNEAPAILGALGLRHPTVGNSSVC